MGRAPGAIRVNLVADYVRFCPSSQGTTTLSVYNAPAGSSSGSLIQSFPITLTGC